MGFEHQNSVFEEMLIEASNWEKELLCPKISQTNKHASICCDFHNSIKNS